MNVWLDDERPAPRGWHACTRPEEVVALIDAGVVDEVSLDHDLGEDVGTGYDVVTYIEERVHTDEEFMPPAIHVHTANSAARLRMNAGVKAIAAAVGRRR